MKVGMTDEGTMHPSTNNDDNDDDDDKTQPPLTGQFKTNTTAKYFNNMIHEAGELTVVTYVYTPDKGKPVTVELYQVPAGYAYYDKDGRPVSLSDLKDTMTIGKIEADQMIPDYFDEDTAKERKIDIDTKPSESSKRLGTSGNEDLFDKSKITVVTVSSTVPESTDEDVTYYRVANDNKYYRTTTVDVDAPVDEQKADAEYVVVTDPGKAPAAFDSDKVKITPVPNADADDMTGAGDMTDADDMTDAGDPPAPPPAGKREVDEHGYTAKHVSAAFDLGGVTLGLGFSEKESNHKDAPDQETTYLGVNGSLGDAGLGWRAWARDVKNYDNAKGDRSPWGVGVNKDLGGGAFVFVEHHNPDNDKDANTIVVMGVNF